MISYKLLLRNPIHLIHAAECGASGATSEGLFTQFSFSQKWRGWVGQQILFFVGNFNFQIQGICYTVHRNRVFKKVMDLDNNLEIKPVPFEKWEELHDPVVYRLAV
jgi:hypothetical protein